MSLSPPRRVTVRDIARRLQVSAATVSRALRDDRRISARMREQVRKVAEALGYRPDPMLAALSHYRRAGTTAPISAELAWLNCWPDPRRLRSFREFDLYWQGASAEAMRCGFRLEEFILDQGMNAARLEKILLARNVQGILIPPHGGVPLLWKNFNWNNFCVVRFGYTVAIPQAHLVTSSQLTDGLIAYENIWRLGYRRIGLITIPKMLTRFGAGYLFGQWRQLSRVVVPPLVLPEWREEKQDRKALNDWLRKYRPDAVLTDIGPIRRLLEKTDHQVPQDIGLAHFSILDGDADAGIDQRSAEIGRAAVQLLISLINHNERGIPAVCRELLIEGRWVDGDSLPPRPAGIIPG
ncbi:MAG TPA: LacI family DNA-binding transcriptional regulator [Verrucomicrobiae bacterium]|nr:LacI family DNA-binding transcriptional regulator [Verrucomicrobiae bacterium]